MAGARTSCRGRILAAGAVAVRALPALSSLIHRRHGIMPHARLNELLPYLSSTNFRPIRPLLVPVGVVADTRHGMSHDSFPRLARWREEGARRFMGDEYMCSIH